MLLEVDVCYGQCVLLDKRQNMKGFLLRANVVSVLNLLLICVGIILLSVPMVQTECVFQNSCVKT